MTYEGNCRLGDLFTSRREKGRSGLPTLSVTLNDGLVNRETLDRKQDTSLAPEDHLLVRPGDIAYNMMRMWQGAFGLAESEGMVSPAYVVLKPKKGVDPLFASYLLKTKRMVYLLWAYSYGLTEDRLRLYFPDFAKIPANIPPKRDQVAIGQLLATWDKAIAVCELLVVANERWRTGLVHEILLGKRRLPHHRQDWKRVCLCNVAEVLVSSIDKKHAADEIPVSICNYTHVYYNRYLTNSLTYDTGTATEAEIERFHLRKGDVVITKDSEQANDIGVAACVTEDMQNLVCGYHLAILRPKTDAVDSTFLSSLFSLHEIRRHLAVHANGVTRFGLPVKAIESLAFSLPPIAVQRELAELIRQFDQENFLTFKQLEFLRRERDALAQDLLLGLTNVVRSEPTLEPAP